MTTIYPAYTDAKFPSVCTLAHWPLVSRLYGDDPAHYPSRYQLNKLYSNGTLLPSKSHNNCSLRDRQKWVDVHATLYRMQIIPPAITPHDQS